jgi:uncharacterized protein with GYD domain
MPKYAVFFKLSEKSVASFIDNPSDRAAAVSKAAQAVGGSLDAYYWMLGEFDGFIIVDMPDSAAVAAVSLAVGSTGAVGSLETHELFEAADLTRLAEQASKVRGQYTPPGG